jgi:hypothetical protein
MKNKQSGMTLIEIMIVISIIISIIAILAAIAIPKFMEMKNGGSSFRLQNGKVVHCLSSYQNTCGMTLSDCDDGTSYRCLTNVQQLTNGSNNAR